jgi:cobalt-zinc-cadmium efflux system protein
MCEWMWIPFRCCSINIEDRESKERKMSLMDTQDEENRSGRQSLTRALVITGIWFVIELAGGFYTNSLALIADAGHMLTDLIALGLSLVALNMATRPATPEKTYGYVRAEILASLANGIFLVLIGSYIFYEAYGRFMNPPAVRSAPMLIVAITGLIANLVTARILYRSHCHNLNLRGAFLHILGDTMGSAGAVIAGVLMLGWRWYLADPIVSVIVGLLVIYSSWQLVRESVDILLESAPRRMNVVEINAELESVAGVLSVHDLHVWSITSDVHALSCHVAVAQKADASEVLTALSHLLQDKYRIQHTTIQLEMEDCPVPGQQK